MITMIPPGETIGILGGGQLGRMLAMAAARLGYRCHVYSPEAELIAADVCAAHTRAAWDDAAALASFAADCAVVTYEFENVPVAPLAAMGDEAAALGRARSKWRRTGSAKSALSRIWAAGPRRGRRSIRRTISSAH